VAEAVSGLGAKGSEPTVRFRVCEVIREVNDAAGIVLVQALAKGGRDEMAVEAATALGVARIVPWAAARSVARWPGAKAHRGRERWEAIVRAETKVARRSWLPAVTALMTTPDIVAAIRHGTLTGPGGADGAARAVVLVLHEGATASYVGAVGAACAELPDCPLVLMVGPEGGIAPQEIDSLVEVGAMPVVLGRAVLRTSAAAPAALAALAALRGTW
jgi:16S rRNA (uracil1498-N3)-methyltransferase